MITGSQANSQITDSDILLLATKLYTPDPPAVYIERSHLNNQLDSAIMFGHPLTLLSAPAGFGKTSLLSAWTNHIKTQAAPICKVTWLSIDENDNDQVRFWSYIIAALRNLIPGVGKTALAALQSQQYQPVNAIVTTLINDIAYATHKETDASYGLIVDDYHWITSPVIHESLAFFIKQLSTLPISLILASRTEPALHIARLRARGHLTYISASALRFTQEESRRFLQKVISLELSESHILALDKRTEGWAAGLQLAAQVIRSRLAHEGYENETQMQSNDLISCFIEEFTGSNQYVLDYLGEEILRQQTPELRDFLFRTSILSQLSSELCDEVCQRNDSNHYLNILNRQNLFLVPLDQQHTWFRYHRLFGEFLTSRSNGTLSAIHTRDLHTRASEWYANADILPDAIYHAFEAQDPERAASLIEAYARRSLVNGETRMLLAWLDKLPRQLIRSRSRLALAKAWALVVAGELAQVGPLLASIPTPQSPKPDAVTGEKAAIISLIAALMGDTETAIQNARIAMNNLPNDDLFMRALLGINLGRAYDMVGDLHQSQHIYEDALDAALQTENTLVAIMALCQLGDIAVVHGDLHTASVKYQRAIRQAEQTGKFLPVVGLAYAAMGLLHYRWGNLPQAETHLDAAINMGKRWESTDILIIASIYSAQVKLVLGYKQQAVILIRQAEQALQGQIVSAPTVAAAEAYLTRLYMRLGKTRAGTQWLNANPLQRENLAKDLYHIQALTRAQVLLIFDEPAAVCAELSQNLDALEYEGYLGYVLERVVNLAVAEASRGNVRAAMAYTRRALELGVGEGDVYTFIEAGPRMQVLLETAVQQGLEADYAQQILAHFNLPDPSIRVIELPKDESLPVPIEALSKREIEVLQLLAKGKVNKEIARSLYITPGTVKQHLKNIYGKLDVHNRTEAANRGRALQLI